MLKVEHKDHPRLVGDKDRRRDPIPDKKERKVIADYVVKKALTVWGDSSSDSEESEHPEDSSMLTVKDDEDVFDAMFAFMEKSDDEEAEEETQTQVPRISIQHVVDPVEHS